MKKKMLSILVILSIVSSISLPIYASDTTFTSLNYLQDVANDVVHVTSRVEDSGAVVYTYTEIDKFVEEVHEIYPNIDDLEIAKALLSFANVDSNDLSNERILDFIKYNNFSISQEQILLLDDGTTFHTTKGDPIPASTWHSSDGYMTIITSYRYDKTVDGEDYFVVSADASWDKFPLMRLEDTFVLGTNAVFDDSYSETGSANQTFYCGNHGKYTEINEYVSKRNTVSGDLKLEYENFVPLIRYNSRTPYCSSGDSDYSNDRNFSLSISYRIISDGSANIQAAYAHKLVGPANISVSISATGEPSFSGGLATSYEPYRARAVTVRR